MQQSKHSEFNPLDILATAAALKQTDKPEQRPKIVIVKPKEGVQIINHKDFQSSSASGELRNETKAETINDKQSVNKQVGVIRTSSFIEDGVKKVKLTISPDLEKMLNEHNYGSIQKINSGNKALLKLQDVLSLGKDKKVIVKVVDKSGDQVDRNKVLAGVNNSDKSSPEATSSIQTHHTNNSETEGVKSLDSSNNHIEILSLENKESKEIQGTDRSSPSFQDAFKEFCSSNDREHLKHVDSDESLTQDQEECFTVPICKPVDIEDFDDCKERIDCDIRSPVYEDIDLTESHGTTPSDCTLSESNTSKDQSLKIHPALGEVTQKQDIALLRREENSISTQTDKENVILREEVENQYSDNESIPGKVETGANNTDRCDMGKSQVLDKVETSDILEKKKNLENNSVTNSPELHDNQDKKITSFPMLDHDYSGKYQDNESSELHENSDFMNISLVNDFSQDSGFSDSGLSPDGLESRTFRRDSPSLIPVKSDMLPSFDLSDVNKARDAIIALANTSNFSSHEELSPTISSPKVGKFSIGKFASVCNSSLGLQSPEKSQIAYGQRLATSLLSNKLLPQSKVRSVEALGCIEHIEHDHDYCLPQQSRPSNIPFSVQKVNKEIGSKGKIKERKGSEVNERRTKRSASSEESQEDKLFNIITDRYGDKKGTKNEKVNDLLKNGSSDSKLKIQGSYKDDFVYFLNTNFRSRRRASQDIPPPIPPDRILVPLPKPGDIVVPHLTNEDLEVIKLGKPSILSSGQHFNGSSCSSSTTSSQPITATSAIKNQNSSGAIPEDENIESRIINTILSMETDPCVDTCSADPSSLFSAANDSFGINFSDQLTPEQMELLYSAVDEVQNSDSKTSVGNEIVTEKDMPVNSLQMGPANVIKTVPSTESTSVKDTSVISNQSGQSTSGSLDVFSDPQPSTVTNSKNEETDQGAPWVVTVSMYWNDLPAIMLDNIPHLRLVDIHKQILPAKDTGILKKRCQLLGVNVKNCTEMQRYFLVQYGKAFNSKSNLIISKDDAEFLVGYYVNPVTKLPRAEEPLPPKVKIPKVTRPRSRPPSRTESEKPKSTVAVLPPPVVKEPPPPPAPLGRTRHKKINFLELLKGDSAVAESQVTDHTEDKKVDGKVSVVVVDPPSSWKKPDSVPQIKKNNVKRSQSVDVFKKKSEESQTIDSAREDDIENKGDKCLTWLSKKPKKLQVKMNNKKMKKPNSLKVKWTIFNKSNKKLMKKKKQREVLTVVHKDLMSNGSHMNNIQPGIVFMDLYNNENAPCVRCCSCNKAFSVDAFLAHQHDSTEEGKLVSVINPQTLSLRDTSDSQKKMWRNFQLKRKRFNTKVPLFQSRVPKSIQKESGQEKGPSILVRPQNNNMSKSVRISSRKRKQKQLYPIENYSYSSTGKPQGNNLMPSPIKMMKVVDAASVDLAENVVTQSNGPLWTSFTALEHDVL